MVRHWYADAPGFGIQLRGAGSAVRIDDIRTHLPGVQKSLHATAIRDETSLAEFEIGVFA